MHGSDQAPPAVPPGWYADPWSPAAVRWWSGHDWTAYTGPAAPAGGPQYGKPTDGFALASLITSGIGIAPVGIVLGLIARRRIRRSGGARDGRGLALAGIAVGCVYLALGAGVGLLALNGAFDEVNSDDYSGEKARVAATVDRFESAFEDADGRRICRDLFTPALASAYQPDGGCESVWGEQGTPGWAEIDVYQLSVLPDGSATAAAHDEGGADDWTFTLTRGADGAWRIDGID
jgi:hypothetical protein